MAHTASDNLAASENTQFKGSGVFVGLGAVLAIVGIGASVALGKSGTAPFRPFLFGYLAAFMFATSLVVGSLAFLLLQHLVGAAWSVTVRRTAENVASVAPLLAILGLPIVLSVASGNGALYRWALPMDRAEKGAVEAADKGETELPSESSEEESDQAVKCAAPSDPAKFKLDPLVLAKRNYGLHWLNPGFFIVRYFFYFAVWTGIAFWYRKTSVAQDAGVNDALTVKMAMRAAPALVVLALTVTGAAFDWAMSLDPHWYSTMFGVTYIANSFLATYSFLILSTFVLQRFGLVKKSISPEHYHDLGKYLFAFSFFYGYVAFSQYMLMWYANIPEETEWFARHGASTNVGNGWQPVIVILLIAHVLIPMAGLLSRHIKRVPLLLAFWALWQLVMVAYDMYWIVLPEFGPTAPESSTIIITVLSAVGLFGAVVAGYAFLAGKVSLRPSNDPRLAESLAFQNI